MRRNTCFAILLLFVLFSCDTDSVSEDNYIGTTAFKWSQEPSHTITTNHHGQTFVNFKWRTNKAPTIDKIILNYSNFVVNTVNIVNSNYVKTYTADYKVSSLILLSARIEVKFEDKVLIKSVTINRSAF